MKNIIIPTDFSANAKMAADYAINTFNGPDTVFWLTHVYRMPYSGAVVSVDLDNMLKEDREKELKNELKAFRTEYPGLEIKGHAIQGMFVDVITKMVANEDIDMIVMGTTGATGAKGVLLGSNAANIVKHAQVPVLLYPKDCGIHAISNVVFASDLKHVKGYETLKPIRQIVKETGAKLDILHLESQEEGVIDVERESLLLDTIFVDLPHGFHVKELKLAEDDILDYARDVNADLIVAVARTYGFFERIVHRSTSRKLSMLTNVPLLILREH
ncbi:MAG: universal stress protein [Flavobacteriales bacterium]|nr:universal stress protein [Flavobacteriales bacterium]